MLAGIVRARGFEDSFGIMWLSNLCEDEQFFDFLMDLFPEQQESLVEEIMQTAAWGISVHVRKRMLQIWQEHGNDPWKMFLKKIPSGIFNLGYKSDDNLAHLKAWFEAMDAYYGIHWVDTVTFDARQSYNREDEYSSMDGIRHSFFDYMIHHYVPNIWILDAVEVRYDLSNVFNTIQPQCEKTPLMKTIRWFYVDVVVQEWFLSRTDIMHPNNRGAIFALVKHACVYSNHPSGSDALLLILRDRWSSYDWQIQDDRGLNAWQVCCAMQSRGVRSEFLENMKQWLESLGAHEV